VEDLNLDVVGANGNPFGNVFNEFALLVLGEVSPAGSEVLGFGDHLVLREVLYAEEVEFPLEGRDLVFELLPAFLHWPVLASEPVLRNLVGEIKLHHPIHLPGELFSFLFEDFEELLFFAEFLVSLREVLGDVVG
jgi:hypothetical protein